MKSRICLYVTPAPHLSRAVRALRDEHPYAELVFLARGTRPSPDVCALADRVVVVEPGSWRALLREARNEHPVLLAVLFPSVPQRMLCARCRAARTVLCTVDGRVEGLDERPLPILIDLLRDRVRGALLFARAWLVVHLTRVRPGVPK